MGGVLQVILIYLTASCIVEFCSSLGGGLQPIIIAANGTCQCGQMNPIFQPEQRIVGGSETGVNQYPWMVHFYFRKNDKYKHCGGSILNDRFILTAAHCAKGWRPRDILIFVGDHLSTTNDETDVQFLFAEDIIIHENYSTTPIVNDVALIRTAGRIDFNDIVSPICLPEPGQDFTDENATAMGWGRTNYTGTTSNVLREVKLRVLSDRECRAESNNKIRSFPEVLCVIGNRKGVCLGDSGGPLVVQNPQGQYEQIGVVSFTLKCSELGGPDGFARVTEYLDWMRDHVNYCSKGEIVYKT